jgi:hypothetical protein
VVQQQVRAAKAALVLVQAQALEQSLQQGKAAKAVRVVKAAKAAKAAKVERDVKWTQTV